MSQRKCPNCKASLPVGSGIRFDEHNNVICASCGKPVVATTAAAEALIMEKSPATTTTGGIYGPGGRSVSPHPWAGVGL